MRFFPRAYSTQQQLYTTAVNMRERTVRRTWRMRECMMYLANELPEYEADNICGLPVGGVEQVGQTVRGEVRQT